MRIIRIAIGVAIGGTAGFLYYWFIGCASGTCPVTSNPYMTVAWGMLLGGTIAWK